MIKTNRRIEAICVFVTEKIIADIGSDHGFITKNLLNKNIVDFAFVTDISLKCLDKAKDNLKDLSSHITFIQGDGLEMFLDEKLAPKNCNFVPKQIIIAGMGGREIKKILSQDTEKKFKKFILQPQKNAKELRQFLQKNKFLIMEDVLVKEGKMFYNIIVAERGDKEQNLTEMEMLFGKTNLEKPSVDFFDFINYEKQKCEIILKKKKVTSIEKKLSMLNKIDLGGKNV